MAEEDADQVDDEGEDPLDYPIMGSALCNKDIDESARNELLEKEVKQLSQAFRVTSEIAEQSTQAVLVIEKDTKHIVWCNKNAQVMFGRLAYEMVGQVCILLLNVMCEREILTMLISLDSSAQRSEK